MFAYGFGYSPIFLGDFGAIYPVVSVGDALLLETGDFILLENGDKLLLE